MLSVFVEIFNMSLVGSYLIVLALIARFFLQSVPKKFTYIIWAIAGVQLILPFSINFQNIINLFQGKEISSIFSWTEYIPRSIGIGLPTLDSITIKTSFLTAALLFLTVIWFLGFAGIILTEAIAYNNARKKLGTAIRVKDNIFKTDRLITPIVFGLINPKIYIPMSINEKELEYALCHEQIHIRRKDNLAKFFAFLVLAIHWFNPFVWLAFKCLNNDIEMSCDEKVVASLGNAVRKKYAETIFNFSQAKIKITRSMLAFGESDTRKRVNNILNKKKSTNIKIVISVVVCAIITLGLIFNSAFGSMFSYFGDQYRYWEIERLQTTDLSDITVDTIQTGSNIEYVDLSVYQESDRFHSSDGGYAYYLDRIVLDIDDDKKVSYIFGYNSEVSIKINNQTTATINDITTLLGDNYLDKTQDSEQGLRKHIYCDSEIGILAEFIYSEHDGQFVWIILRKLSSW